jgi:hypothetical protein
MKIVVSPLKIPLYHLGQMCSINTPFTPMYEMLACDHFTKRDVGCTPQNASTERKHYIPTKVCNVHLNVIYDDCR